METLVVAATKRLRSLESSSGRAEQLYGVKAQPDLKVQWIAPSETAHTPNRPPGPEGVFACVYNVGLLSIE